jgi:hypothetical protein
MGFWHPGMHGVYDPTSIVIPKFLPSPVIYGCEVCQRNFSDIEKLRRHRFELHPIRQPALLINGRPVSGTPLKVQSALTPSDVIIEDAPLCWVDGKSTTEDSLRLLLANATTTFHKIRLYNNGVQTEVSLDFQVAKESDLTEVERALVRLAMGKHLTLEAVSRFINECRDLATGILYCDGIAHYLYGVMAKEQMSSTSLNITDYPSRFSQAYDQLTDINRPVARSVRALISFHFNHFQDAEALAPVGNLQKVASAFAGLLEGKSWNFPEDTKVTNNEVLASLLTDQATLEILRDSCIELSTLKSNSEFLTLSLSKISAGYDRSKRILLAVEALSHRAESDSKALAKKIIRELLPQDFARTWCEVISQRLKNK